MIGSGLRVREDIGICIKSYCLELEPNPPQIKQANKKDYITFCNTASSGEPSGTRRPDDDYHKMLKISVLCTLNTFKSAPI